MGVVVPVIDAVCVPVKDTLIDVVSVFEELSVPVRVGVATAVFVVETEVVPVVVGVGHASQESQPFISLNLLSIVFLVKSESKGSQGLCGSG